VKRSLSAVVLAAALFGVGCGGQSDTDKVKSTVQTYVDGLASRNAKKVCDQLSASVQTQVKQSGRAKDCATAIRNFENSANGRAVAAAFKTAKISEINVKGNIATAKVTVKVSANGATVPLEKQGGDWKITAPAQG
jgi:hypothetical protein